MEPAVAEPLARTAMLTDSEDDQPLTTHSNPTKVQKTSMTLSDSDDDDDDDNDLNTRGLSAVDNLNIPDRLKRLMRDAKLADDDSDSEDDDDPLKDHALFRTPAAVKAAEVQSMLRTAPQPPTASTATKETAATSTPKKPRRQRKKKQQQPAGTSDTDGTTSPGRSTAVDPMTRPRAPFEFLNESSSSSDESDDAQRPEKTKQRKKKDERPAKRAMSKQAELKMRMENQRLTRQMVATVQPRMNKLSFTEMVERLKHKKDEQQQHQQQQQPGPSVDADAERRKRAAKNHARMMLQDDDDLEIINIPPQLRALALASPEQPRHYAFQQFQQTSPRQQRRHHQMVTQGDLNKRLQRMIAQEMLSRRKELQDMAKARGEFKTATEIAEEQLSKEKQAEAIGLQVEQHFAKDTTTTRKKKEKADVPEEEDDLLVYSGESDDEAEEDDDDEVMGVAVEEDKPTETRTDDQPLVSTEDQDQQQHPALEEDDETQTRKRKWKNVILSDSDESGSENGSDNEGEMAESGNDNSSSEGESQATAKKSKQNDTPKQKNHYLDAEAEEEEDEYFGAGGPEDSDEGEDLDRFEQDGMLVDKSDEHVDEEALRAALNLQLAESDKHMVDRLVKDILSGDLRRRRATREAGLMLDDFDIFDDRDDNDLVALRRAANEERRRRLQNSDDPLVALARDPKTSAFAKALQPLPENVQLLDLSDHEEEQDTQVQGQSEDEDEDDLDPRSHLSLVIPDEEDDDDDEDGGVQMVLDDDDDDLDQAMAMIEQRQRAAVSTDQSMQDFFSGRRIGTQK